MLKVDVTWENIFEWYHYKLLNVKRWYTSFVSIHQCLIFIIISLAFVHSYLKPRKEFEIAGSVCIPWHSLFVPLWNSRGKQLILHIPDFSVQGVIFGHEPHLCCHWFYIAPSSLSLNRYYICCTAAVSSGPETDAASAVGEFKCKGWRWWGQRW